MADSDKKRPMRVTHKINLASDEFQITAKAIYELTVKYERFHTFKDVILTGLELCEGLQDSLISELSARTGSEGSVTLYIKLDTATNRRLDRLRASLPHAEGEHRPMADAMMCCARAISHGNFSACN